MLRLKMAASKLFPKATVKDYYSTVSRAPTCQEDLVVTFRANFYVSQIAYRSRLSAEVSYFSTASTAIARCQITATISVGVLTYAIIRRVSQPGAVRFRASLRAAAPSRRVSCTMPRSGQIAGMRRAAGSQGVMTIPPSTAGKRTIPAVLKHRTDDPRCA